MSLLQYLLMYSGIYCWLHNEHEWPVVKYHKYRFCNRCGRHEVKINGKWRKV